MPFPDFEPVIFQIGPFALRWYALAYVAGIVLAWLYAVRLVKSRALWGPAGPPATQTQIDDLVLWATLGVILGGRLGYILFYRANLLWTDPLEVLQIWKGGMSFHGGVIGVLLAAGLFARSQKIDLLRLGDLVTPAVPFGMFFGRLANFINGELWGRETEAPWGVIFPGAPGGLPRHPSQLYEAALEGLLLFLILRWATHGAKLLPRRGMVAGLFFLFMGLFRIAVEFVREPDDHMHGALKGYVTMGMILSLPLVLFGLWLIVRARRQPLPEFAATTEAPQPAATTPA